MPLKMDEDGNIINEATRAVPKPAPRRRPGDGASRAPGDPRTADIARPTRVYDGAPTEPRRGSPHGRLGADTERVGGLPRQPGGRTKVYRPGSPTAPGRGGAGGDTVQSGGVTADPSAGAAAMADPPVGWLIVVKGPGRGRVATLGFGVNSIGRDRTERVSLDYGDQAISRKNHGAITYDPRGRKFYVQPGGGTNLTYVDAEPVLAPRELDPSMHVQLGDTVLRFVPLCGADFSWDDESDDD